LHLIGILITNAPKMNGFTDMENSRNCLRRIINDDQEFSNQSIINVIERFVKSVNLMEETILIPSRLMDRQVGDESDSVQTQKTSEHHHRHHHSHNKKKSGVRDNLANQDLFNLYTMLNSVKVDLLWGRNEGKEDETTEVELREQNYDTVEVAPATEIKPVEAPTPAPPASTESQSKGHVRRPSTVSVASSNSSTSTISDSESEVSSNENDSGIESEGQQNKDKSLDYAKQFRTHLLGLYNSLEQMTDAATYLTTRYQSDIGGGNC
jgi:hypothetical protein